MDKVDNFQMMSKYHYLVISLKIVNVFMYKEKLEKKLLEIPCQL